MAFCLNSLTSPKGLWNQRMCWRACREVGLNVTILVFFWFGKQFFVNMFQKGFLNCIIWIDHRHTTKPSSIVLHITTARTTSVFSVMPQMIIDVVIQTSSITLSDPCWMLLFSNSSFPPTTGENKLAKLRRCVSREHFAKIYFAKIHFGKIHFGNQRLKAFRKYITSHGLRTLCNGTETTPQWKSESVTDVRTNLPG